MQVREEHLQVLEWAAQRITSATLSFHIKLQTDFASLGPPVANGLEDAFVGRADLSNVRCFDFEPAPDCPAETIGAAFGEFQAWVTNNAPRLKALRLQACGPYLAACTATLVHLKHLEMDAYSFASGVAEAAALFPSLETLCLQERGQGNEGINVLECEHLRQLVVKGRYLRPVFHEPTCQLGIDMDGFTLKSLSRWEKNQRISETDEGKTVWAGNSHESPPEGGMCGDITTVSSLKVAWPVLQDWFSQRDEVAEEHALPKTESIPKWCMPTNGQSLGNLEAITITAEGAMECCIPNAMPNLEELVLFAKGGARVSFEDPVATLTALNTLYLFGQPLMAKIRDSDMTQVSASFADRGLLLSTAPAKRAGKISARCSSCMYLRPATAQELSIQELHDRVSKLARQCRCRACFECLERAGCLTCC